MRTILCASLLLALVGCGDDGLTVRGQVVAVSDVAPDTPTGFDFVETTRLVDLAYEEPSGTVLNGSCQLREDGGLTLTIQGPGAPPEGVGMHRFELTLPAEGAGDARVQLGTDDYSAEVGADCEANILYRDDGDGAVGAEVDCSLSGPDAATATLTAELHYGGCQTH